jgi:hypothetical protein
MEHNVRFVPTCLQRGLVPGPEPGSRTGPRRDLRGRGLTTSAPRRTHPPDIYDAPVPTKRMIKAKTRNHDQPIVEGTGDQRQEICLDPMTGASHRLTVPSTWAPSNWLSGL